MSNVGTQKKSMLCYNALIRDEMSCDECERLRLKPRRCIGTTHGLDCDKMFTPVCTRKFICETCHIYNKTREDFVPMSTSIKG